MSWLLDRSRGALLLARDEPVERALVERFDAWLERRAAREPAQHIVGEQEFHGLRFRVTRDVLVPRPETELLVDALVDAAPRDGWVVDLGTGSGCIAVAAAVARKDLRFGALDCSRAALDVARLNAERHGVDSRIELVVGDFADPPRRWRGKADVVASNPPYVGETDWAHLQPEVRDHDPKVALVGGAEGLDAYRSLVPAAKDLLLPGGMLLLEIGFSQADEVMRCVTGAGFENVEALGDLNRIPRLIRARSAC